MPERRSWLFSRDAAAHAVHVAAALRDVEGVAVEDAGPGRGGAHVDALAGARARASRSRRRTVSVFSSSVIRRKLPWKYVCQSSTACSRASADASGLQPVWTRPRPARRPAAMVPMRGAAVHVALEELAEAGQVRVGAGIEALGARLLAHPDHALQPESAPQPQPPPHPPPLRGAAPGSPVTAATAAWSASSLVRPSSCPQRSRRPPRRASACPTPGDADRGRRGSRSRRGAAPSRRLACRARRPPSPRPGGCGTARRPGSCGRRPPPRPRACSASSRFGLAWHVAQAITAAGACWSVTSQCARFCAPAPPCISRERHRVAGGARVLLDGRPCGRARRTAAGPGSPTTSTRAAPARKGSELSPAFGFASCARSVM